MTHFYPPLLAMVADAAPPPAGLLLPFLLVLVMIATFPTFFKAFWHRYHPHICVGLGLAVPLYYLLVEENYHAPVEAFFDYFQFISLIFSLYMASNLINIQVHSDKKVLTNVLFLFSGALLANLIGTTGASMLLIKPFIRLNKGRVRPYHVVFFIFVVSNVGGGLTPIGDPPLFLGFLKGVPFLWMLKNMSDIWLFVIITLLSIFYLIDRRNKAGLQEDEKAPFKVLLVGWKGVVWLALIISSVFLDPNLIEGLPHIPHGDGGNEKASYLRELIMLCIGFFSYRYANKKVLQLNNFNFLPIKEVAFLFVGIFGTMIPALEFIKHHGASMGDMLTPSILYWSTGMLSGFLDNAPTYLNFLAASMSSHQADVHVFSQVAQYARGSGTEAITLACLRAISSSAVFFGALTYIGNGPNFMVRAIAENLGIEMPSFLQYILKYSLCILLPTLFLAWLLFIYR